MIICASNLSFQEFSFKKFISYSNKIGITNVEIAPALILKNFTNHNLKKNIKEILKKNNSTIISLQSIFFDARNPHNCNIEKLKKTFLKTIKFANFFKIKKISLGSCPTRQLKKNYEELKKVNLYFIRALCDIAHRENIIICMEPIHEKYNNNFLNNHSELLNFIRNVRKKNLKMLFDTGNLMDNKDNIYLNFLKYKKHLSHIHFSDKNLKKINLIILKDFLKFLKINKYKGTITIEYFSTNGTYNNNLKNIISNYI